MGRLLAELLLSNAHRFVEVSNYSAPSEWGDWIP
jgi:hypothetical protein